MQARTTFGRRGVEPPASDAPEPVARKRSLAAPMTAVGAMLAGVAYAFSSGGGSDASGYSSRAQCEAAAGAGGCQQVSRGGSFVHVPIAGHGGGARASTPGGAVAGGTARGGFGSSGAAFASHGG